MPRTRSFLAVPDRLGLLVKQLDGGVPAQPPVLLEPARWRTRNAIVAATVDELPAELTRASVRAFVAEGLTVGRSPVAGFIATQIWGYGATGYGPWRLAAALASDRLESALWAACDLLEAGDPVGACRMICVDHEIPKLGMAFATKFLYFADPYGRSLILDSVIRTWLGKHAGVHLAGRRDEREYAVWLLLAEGWAAELGLAAEDVELVLFNDALPARSSWRPHP